MEEKGALYVEAARRIRQTRPDGFGVLGFSEEPEILERTNPSDEGIIEYFGYVQDVRPYTARHTPHNLLA